MTPLFIASECNVGSTSKAAETNASDGTNITTKSALPETFVKYPFSANLFIVSRIDFAC